MAKLEDTNEYKLGRNGEILMHAFAIENGCTTFDIAGSAHGKAPVFNSRSRNIIAPDALYIRNIATLNEHKTKTNTFDWRGGSIEMSDKAPPCLMHGIDARHYADYKSANLKLPVILWFLTINTGMLHIASVDELGEPFESVHSNYPMVNWPISRMFHVVSFDTNRLWAYFRQPRRHDGLPTAGERKEILRWLRPRQSEFDGFAEHFLICHEQSLSRRPT